MRISRRVSILLLTALVLCAVSGVASCTSATEEVPIEAEAIIVGFGDGTDGTVLAKGSPEFKKISDEAIRIIYNTNCIYAGLLSVEDQERLKPESEYVEVWFSEPVTLRSRGMSVDVTHLILAIAVADVDHIILYPWEAHQTAGPPREPFWGEWGSRRSFSNLERLVDDLR